MSLFSITIYHRRHPDDIAVETAMLRQINQIVRKVDIMRTEIQRLVDEVANLKSLEASSNAAWDAMVEQAADAKKQIEALKAQVAQGGIDEGDLAALNQAVNDIHDAAVGMRQAVPANTDAAPPADRPE